MIDTKEALNYLNTNYPDTHINNNESNISNRETEVNQFFQFKSMKQSIFKNIVFKDALFENVALTGSSFDSIKFINTKLIGNSFANCYFYNAEINGTRAAFVANNFSQSSFEQCKFKKVKFFRSGILNALYHNCFFEKVECRGSTLEGTQFVGCTFSSCDFSNVNIDYTLFSNNKFNRIYFPFYQIAYIIGSASFMHDTTQTVYAKAGEKIVTSEEYNQEANKLILYYIDKGEYFPACNLLIAQNRYDEAKTYLLVGIEKALNSKNFRMISNFCRLAKYHAIVTEDIKKSILKAMTEFIQSDGISASQLNNYLIYIGNIKSMLNEGNRDTVTLNYSIKTTASKDDAESVRRINETVEKLNHELSKSEGVEGFEISITNHSPYEITLGIITSLLMIPSVIDSVMSIISRIKKACNLKSEKVLYEMIDSDTHKRYINERIERMKLEMLRLQAEYKDTELNDHIVEVTQSLKTDLEALYSKEIMIYKIRKKG